MKDPMTVTAIASMIKTQFKMTRPAVTWFFWTIANTDRANVTSRKIPRTVPAIMTRVM